jgi:mannose-6-phosphate isomerase-like protein (cupin superfamily)
LAFFTSEAVAHFREEEELLFPRVVDVAETHELILLALLEHQRLHAAAAQLGDLIARGDSVDQEMRERMRELAAMLEGHVRLEERRLFPLIERVLPEETLRALGNTVAPTSKGPIWGTASEDLNATLLAWGPGEGPPDHVNRERDVLVVVLAGSVTVNTDEGARELTVGETTIIAKGLGRKITSGSGGARYLSVHLRRPSLQIARVSH